VIRSDNKSAIAKATPTSSISSIEHVTKRNPSGFAYEGYFFIAQDSHGVPYLATFNHWRAPHPVEGVAANESLYPFPHG